jgi:hypothetical protein
MADVPDSAGLLAWQDTFRIGWLNFGRADPQQGSVVVAQGAAYCPNGLDRQGHESGI